MTSGVCRCGAVTFRIKSSESPSVYVCHCLDCQTWSGSAFCEHALLVEDAVEFKGQTVSFRQVHDSGASEHFFCQTCFTRLFNRNDLVPGMVIVRAGTIIDSHRLNPIAHIWLKRKQPWVAIPEGVPGWSETPSPEEFGFAVRNASRMVPSS